MEPVTCTRRIGIFSPLLMLYFSAVGLGAVSFPEYHNASGLRDLGHYYVRSLALLIGKERAEYVLWLGTLPLELFFTGIALSALFTGRGIRLGMCLYFTYFLHWLCLHATTLPPPDHIMWKFPEGVFTFGKVEGSDFWLSGHVAIAFVIALATNRSRPWMKGAAWAYFLLQILLVLSARTHYTIDVLGGMCVGYSMYRMSLDLTSALYRSSSRGKSP